MIRSICVIRVLLTRTPRSRLSSFVALAAPLLEVCAASNANRQMNNKVESMIASRFINQCSPDRGLDRATQVDTVPRAVAVLTSFYFAAFCFVGEAPAMP